MKNRWFGTQSELKELTSRPDQSQPSVTPSRFPREEAFWRSWLATGARRVPIDRRRARGAEAYLKKILVGGPSGAVDFSSAMARQAIDEALHELPPRHKQVVKLAYFGGLTNREIAQELDLSVSEVRHTLQASLAALGAHLERGRAKGRRAIQDLALLPLWRGIADGTQRTPWPSLDHVLQTGIVAAMTVAAAALLVTHQGTAHVGHTHKPQHVAAIGSAGSSVVPARQATLVEAMNPKPWAMPVADVSGRSGTLASLPVKVTAPVQLPLTVGMPSVVPSLRAPRITQLPFGA